jgi:preprotein translocase subunit YajC
VNGGFLVFMVLLLVVMYVLMIRPQRQRQQQQQSMIDGCSVGDDVLTTGGIYGTVVQAEGDDLVVEIADGMTVHMTRRGVAAVLPPETDDEDEEVEEELDVEDEVQAPAAEVDEGSVTADEEAVTDEAAREEVASDRN